MIWYNFIRLLLKWLFILGCPSALLHFSYRWQGSSRPVLKTQKAFASDLAPISHHAHIDIWMWDKEREVTFPSEQAQLKLDFCGIRPAQALVWSPSSGSARYCGYSAPHLHNSKPFLPSSISQHRWAPSGGPASTGPRLCGAGSVSQDGHQGPGTQLPEGAPGHLFLPGTPCLCAHVGTFCLVERLTAQPFVPQQQETGRARWGHSPRRGHPGRRKRLRGGSTGPPDPQALEATQRGSQQAPGGRSRLGAPRLAQGTVLVVAEWEVPSPLSGKPGNTGSEEDGWGRLRQPHTAVPSSDLVLETTLESPLDCKDINTVSPKGGQPWLFIGRADAEDEAPILRSPDAKSRLIGKDPDAGKDWRAREGGDRGWDVWMASQTQQAWVWANSGRQWRTGKLGVLQSKGSQRVGHDWAPGQWQHHEDKEVLTQAPFFTLILGRGGVTF